MELINVIGIWLLALYKTDGLVDSPSLEIAPCMWMLPFSEVVLKRSMCVFS